MPWTSPNRWPSCSLVSSRSSRTRRIRRSALGADGHGRILVVEDEASLADSIRYNLEREGFAVDVAPDGRRALERFGEAGADLVVLDLMLPEVTGLDVCREIGRAHV